MWQFAKRILSSSRLIVSVIALIISSLIASGCLLFRDRYIDRELSAIVTLNQEWLELIPEKPLTVERDTQEITLYPDPPIQMVFADNSSKLIPADGRSADIEAELIDGNNVTYRSSPGVSQTMTGDLQVTSRSLNFKDLPKDAVFKKVRIRSSSAYPVKKILWSCYNWAEVRK
jgi:hypothetical protein